MKIVYFLIVLFVLQFTISSISFSQEIKRKPLIETRYLLNDSTGSYLIKETVLSDGTKTYSLIPKSYLYDTINIQKVLPDSVKDWFYKVKGRNNISSLSISNNKDTLKYLFNKYEPVDTTNVYTKKNKTAWWIIGSTTVAGGIIAYIFLKYRKGLEELPIQPDPPK